MININNKQWDKLRFSDIEKMLAQTDDETFFFEFKSDEESPAKFIKEVSAFSNTFGGYILLGIRDDKTIEGCKKWTEQRIHATIHDSITPVPNFDVRKFRHDGKTIFVVRIEEGTMPPYITNGGKIFERISSGSFPINESSKLSQLYRKKTDNLRKIRDKIEIDKIVIDKNTPGNLCAYIDLGFSVVCSEETALQKHFYDIELEPVVNVLRSENNHFSISRMGHAYVISIGQLSAKDGSGHEVMANSGIHNYIEIMYDGSVKSRIVLTATADDPRVDITNIFYMNRVYCDLYTKFLGEDFHKIFISAHKYEKLTVLKQFVPYFAPKSLGGIEGNQLSRQLPSHRIKYGDNLVINSERVPRNDYFLIDKRLFDILAVKYNLENLIRELFASCYMNLGYIDYEAEDNSQD